MKYYVRYKSKDYSEEIDTEKARDILSGYLESDLLADIFDNNKSFRLYTADAEVWTNNNGLVPMAGLYGIAE